MNDQVQSAAPAATSKTPNSKKPGGNNQSTRPLNEQEIAEITNAITRTPGLGRIVLSLTRNRNARIFVPETALGSEMFTIVGELDRVCARGDRLLARSLTLENMQQANQLKEQALSLILPMADLTADLALKFDNPQNSIVRHARTKALLAQKRKEAQSKGKEATPVTDSQAAA
ncbi:hypothetical protein RQP54_18400 [Curvibacter sp. APW13]|uniref:hypothetical protein n=1 Tax=Curvibacter sp. APW13 TaxID=3077236 RepID=UPI0028E06182|nr:hypothetical protein [Curvibacter sp. APW13]MDT8992851.1 hypothetical protein [Curvibacter sp. APW13]